MNRHAQPTGPNAFAFPDQVSGSLSATVAASLLASVGDVAFILDAQGTIRDVAVSNPELATRGFAEWIGLAWVDTVTGESIPKIAELMADAGKGGAARWRQVNHATADGDVPVRYLLMAIGDKGGLIAIGRDMRATAAMQQRLLQTQQSLERDYIRLRQAEARYRLLFDMASEPVLIVDATTCRIREANPAARRLLGGRESALTDQPVSGIIDPADREAFVAQLGAASAADDVPPGTLHLAHGRGEVRISARLFRQGRTALLLVRLMATHTAADVHHQETQLLDVVEHMPDAFVLVDADLTVLRANAAFIELTELASADRVVGASLGTWLGRPGIDLDLILGQLREHGAVRNIATIVRGAAGAREEVELSAVAAPGGEMPCYGFTIRSVGRRLRGLPAADRDMPRSVEQLTELVGRMSLKEIVRESTDLIERLCIEAALAYTDDNRASAAEILGVSRQSLYSKLHRHGLGNLVANSE